VERSEEYLEMLERKGHREAASQQELERLRQIHSLQLELLEELGCT
jgi:hypothetical protein